jgi:hypothetical protein
MTIAAGPRVSSTDLTLSLDSGNTKSYPGSGTTWTNLNGTSVGTGTLTNGPTYSSADRGSILLDGVNDFVSVPDNAALRFTLAQSFTLSLWAKPAVLPNKWVGLVTKSRDTSNWYGIWINPDNNIVFGGGGSNFIGPAATTNWQHIVIVKNSTTRYIYINGALSATTTATQTTDGSAAMYIGKGTSDECFNGNISNVSVHSKELSADEIAQNFNALRGRYGI